MVFRGTQSRLNRTVAIKVLLVDDVMTTQANVARELETTVALSSQPHIVSIIDTGVTDDGSPYIVMEYCEGGSYAQILKRRGPLPVAEVLEVGIKIGEALHAAHEVGIVHRDVKPPNILRSRFGPALADFGIARAADDGGIVTSTLDKLTPHHASPEALMRAAQSGLSDVYSLASTMWNLLVGWPPFHDTTQPRQDPMAFRERVLRQPMPRVPRDDVPEWLQAELAKAMAKNPAERHASAGAFAEALQHGSRMSASPWAPAASAAPPMSAPPASAPPFAGPPPGSGAPTPPTYVPAAPVSARPASAPPTADGPTPDESTPTEIVESAGYPGNSATVLTPSETPSASMQVIDPPSLWPNQVPAQPAATPQQPEERERREPEARQTSSRGRAVAATSALGVVFGVLIVAATSMLGDKKPVDDREAATPGPTQSAALTGKGAPRNVRLAEDHGSSVTITWQNAADSKQAPNWIMGAQSLPGQQPRLMRTAEAGATSVTLHGLSSKADYCFRVVAVYSHQSLAHSDAVCTQRLGRPTSPVPSTGGPPAPTKSPTGGPAA
jgi:serine/threonine protein kinase